MPTFVNPKHVVESDPLVISELLRNRNYIVPAYQRDYVWKDQQVKDLWSDIVEHFNKFTDNENLKRDIKAYFLGSMVVVKGGEGDKLEVIDGQQRLTTVTCVVSVLLEELNNVSTPDDEILGLRSQMEDMLASYSGGDWVPRLSLADTKTNGFLFKSCKIHKRQEDRNTYWDTDSDAKNLLQKKKSAAARIKASICIIHNALHLFLSEAEEGKRIKRLKSICSIVAECMVVLLIEAQSISAAYELFESLNYRGMPLAQSDLIKNEVLKSATSEEDRQEVLDNWTNLKESLETHDLLMLPDFLHYSFLSRYQLIKATLLFRSVCDSVGSLGSTKYTSETLEDAKNLEKLVVGDSINWKETPNNSLSDLHKVLNIKLTYISLLAAVRSSGSDKDNFDKYVQVIINFAFRFMKVLEADVSQYASIMHEIAKMISTGESPEDVAIKLKSYASDSSCIEKFKVLSVNTAKLGYYIVYRLECPRLSGTLPLKHGEEQHLEHIMPKGPSVTQWPDAKALKASDADKFNDFLWRIGNLLPLPQDINCHIKNKKISYKIDNSSGKSYRSSDLVSPKEIETFLDASGNWTPETIAARQNDLAIKHFVNAWPL
jgi:hypothetical protein